MEERSTTGSWRDELIVGLYALREGAFQRAEEHFYRAHRAAPEQPEAAFALGRERLRHGRVTEAEALLRAAWRGDPSLISAGATLARCVGLSLGNAPEAHAVLDEANWLHGYLPWLEVTRAELLAHEGRFDEAERRARGATRSCDAGGDSEATRAAASAVLARVENSRGLAAIEGGDPEAALFAFKRAADRDPSWGAPHLNTGAAFYKLGRLRAARAAYERALGSDPENALAHHNLALLSLEAGDRADALANLERAAELSPGDAAISSALAELRDAPGPGGPSGA